MTLAEKINNAVNSLKTKRTAIINAIREKGIVVDENTKLDELPQKIEEIEGIPKKFFESYHYFLIKSFLENTTTLPDFLYKKMNIQEDFDTFLFYEIRLNDITDINVNAFTKESQPINLHKAFSFVNKFECKGLKILSHNLTLPRCNHELSMPDLEELNGVIHGIVVTPTTKTNFKNLKKIGENGGFKLNDNWGVIDRERFPKLEELPINTAAFGYCKYCDIDLPLIEKINHIEFSYANSIKMERLKNTYLNNNPQKYIIQYAKIIDLPVFEGEINCSNCLSLTSINLPAVTSLGDSVFSNCSSLTSINLPAVTSLGDSVFSNCLSLTSINLPAVTSLGNSVFYNCSSLTSINLPAVTSLGNSVFYNCSSLTSINLPAVTSLGNSVFYNIKNLKRVYLNAKISIYNAYHFINTPLGVVFYTKTGEANILREKLQQGGLSYSSIAEIIELENNDDFLDITD